MIDPALLARSATALLPVLAFLAGLLAIDSYKLVRLRAVGRSLAAGVVVAAVCFFLHAWLLAVLDVGPRAFSRYVAPFTEEGLKALYLIYLIRSAKVGFLVDAAIHGFAIGAGFAFAENLYYLQALPEAGLGTWIVRGFGTALMHGGTMTLLGLTAKTLYDRSEAVRGALAWLPALALAVALHAAFNRFLLPPFLSTALLVAVLPLLVALAFHQSEKATRRWLGSGFDTDQELLKLLGSRGLPDTRVGRYLSALEHRFERAIVADLLCLLRIHVELAIRAKGLLMMQEAGFRPPPDPQVEAKFAELRYLEERVGTTGRLALAPFLRASTRDLWQLNMLEQT